MRLTALFARDEAGEAAEGGEAVAEEGIRRRGRGISVQCSVFSPAPGAKPPDGIGNEKGFRVRGSGWNMLRTSVLSFLNPDTLNPGFSDQWPKIFDPSEL